jgi:chromosome segregation ATPase
MEKEISRLASFREKSEEAQKNSVKLAREAEKAQESLAKVKEEVEQAELRATETTAELKTLTEAEATARKEATQARDRLKIAIRHSEEMIKLANEAKAKVEQASKRLETLKEKVEKNPGDTKSVKALEQAGHDFEEVQKNSVEVTREFEKTRENLTWVKGEVEHADMRVTKAEAAVKTSKEAEAAAKKESAQARDRIKTVAKQSEETIKLANKAKNEAEQANKKLEIQKIKEGKKDKRDAEDKGEKGVITSINTEEDKIISNELYQGKIKIHIDRPVTRGSIKELEDSLVQDTGLTVASIGGSIEEGAYLFIRMDQPSPLETLLAELPVIERISADKKNIHITLKTV